VILGDMNSKISGAHLKNVYNQKTNRNGRILLELSHENEKSLCIANAKFQKRMGKDGHLRVLIEIAIFLITSWST